jgi:predicted metal-dependent enzyme (double-stranded beta helix superfamily)
MTPHEIPDDERVGTRLLFENEVVRVWEMKLAPGDASPAHRHRCDYVIAYASGLHAEILLDDERRAASYEAGHVGYFSVGVEGSQLQQLTNTGDDEHLHFVIELVDRNEAAASSSNARR